MRAFKSEIEVQSCDTYSLSMEVSNDSSGAPVAFASSHPFSEIPKLARQHIQIPTSSESRSLCTMGGRAPRSADKILSDRSQDREVVFPLTMAENAPAKKSEATLTPEKISRTLQETSLAEPKPPLVNLLSSLKHPWLHPYR